MDQLIKMLIDLLGGFVDTVMRHAPAGGHDDARDEPNSELEGQGE